MDADAFRHRMSQLPQPETDKKPPYWEAWRLDLWQRAQTQDPTRFWEWPCVYHTMLQNHWTGVIRYEAEQLRNLRNYEFERFRNTVVIPHFGPPDYFPSTQYSMNLIHQAYHIYKWETTTGQRINTLDTIVEFGGGYGAMALLCHRLGFEGKYIICDLPEFSLLQEYYLSQFGLLANVEWNPVEKPKDVDLFTALYSLSEVEPEKRMGYLPSVVNSYLFLYSGQWEAWDNVKWFQEEFPAKWRQNDNVQWRHTELAHLPDPSNFYSISW